MHRLHKKICSNRKPTEDYRIYVGSNDLDGNGTFYKVQEIIAHEQHNKPRFAYDVAVIRIQGSIELNDKVKIIEYSSEKVPDDAVAQLTGWGQLVIINLLYFLTFSMKI